MYSKNDRIQILHVEDEKVDHMAVMRMVRDTGLPYDIDWASSLAEASEKLNNNNSYDMILLDYQLPDGNGIDVLKKTEGIPFIFITGGGDEIIAVNAMKGGASDYIVKDAEFGYVKFLPIAIDKALRTLHLERKHKKAVKQIIKQNAELKTINSELSTLYKLSTVISRTIDLKDLLSSTLNIITGLEALRVERKGVIFIVEGNRMKLVSELGESDSFIDAHNDMKVGDCLCGLAAKTGEAVVSKDSHKDTDHTIEYPGMSPLGHIAIPLKTADRVVGVLCLYTKVGAEVNDNILKLLHSIGNQLGMAIHNAMLYEETKSLSLHDSLTDLANRRLMYIELESSVARAKRYSNSLSVVMMDIDYFKKYNDTYGHLAGDKLLVDIAKIALKEIRETDLLVRYGGEEFILLLPDTDSQGALEASEKIRERIKEKAGVTISLGVSSFSEDIEDGEELIGKADDALYKAKQKGRDRVEVME